MDETILNIRETKDVEYLNEYGKFIQMSIENWYNRLKDSELNITIKNSLIKESNMNNTPYEEYIFNKSKYLLEIKEAYINRLIELQK